MAEEFKPLLQRWRESRSGASHETTTPTVVDTNSGPTRLSETMVVPRETPKGTTLVKHTDDEVIMRVRFVLQYWWPFLPVLLFAFTIFGAPALGTAVGFMISSWDTNLVPITVTAFVLASIFATIVAVKRTRGEVTVIVQPDKIKFGDKVYDRRYHNGMRIGYTIDDGGDDSLKTDFLDQQMGFAALRLTYGRWGEDLPYLVNKYHSAEIVIWMNELIASVGAPAQRDIDPSRGIRQQRF